VHHIIPIKRGGSALALDNMEGKCWSCHSRHHARDGWGRGQRYESNSRW
jgi:5-methylcytosine-specific restriction endonuclease McrA